MEIRTVIGTDGVADMMMEIVEEMQLPLSERFTLGVMALHTAAEAVAKRNPEFGARIEAKTKGMSPGRAIVLACTEYLLYVEECRENDKCACGSPDCGPPAVSSESSTSVH